MANMNLRKINMIREMERNRTEKHGGDYGRREQWEPESRRRMTYVPPYGEPEMRKYSYPVGAYGVEETMDRLMGFVDPPMDNYDPEMRRRRRSDGTYMQYGAHEDEPIRFGGMVSMEGGKRSGGHHKMTREMAEEWVEGLEGDDPAKPHGAKWTVDQIKPIAQKYGIPTAGDRLYEFWAVMNALYSDYYGVAKKHNALTPDFFADMAMAFISDKDAVNNKSAIYYECIAKK